MSAPRANPSATRIEGELLSITGETWSVDGFSVTVTTKAVIYPHRDLAQPGARVLVTGEQYDKFVLAEVVQVLAAAGAAPRSYEYTGPLRKKGDTSWFVGETLIRITAVTNTQPDSPKLADLPEGALVRATVLRNDPWLDAVEVRVLAADANNVPVAIEGIVEQVNEDTWVVDNQTIVVPAQQALPVEQGDTVEVAALQQAGGLVAQQTSKEDTSLQASVVGYLTEVGARGQDDQTWSLLVFEGNQERTEQIHVTPETYVDEDRATVEPGREAEVQGAKTGASSVDAALIRLNQPVSGTVAGALTPSSAGGVWLVGGERVWFGAEALKQQARAAAGQWTEAANQAGEPANIVVRGVRLSNGVLVAQQVERLKPGLAAALLPAAGASAPGAADWDGPTGVNTAAVNASQPTVLFDARGGGHAVYAANGVIYYSYQPRGGAWGAPRKIGMGATPAAVLDANGLVHVAYRADFLDNSDILHVHSLPGGGWSLSTIIAATSGASADPTLAADATGKVYVAWMDLTSGQWAIQVGAWDGRVWTTYPVYYGRGQSPALVALPQGGLFIAWQDRVPTANDLFGKYEIFASEQKNVNQYSSLPAAISDNQTYHPGSNSIGIHLTRTADGDIHAAWVDDNVQVRYVYGQPGAWPVPRDAGPRRDLVRGVSIEAAADGQLYLALDEGAAVSVIIGSPRAWDWPTSLPIATRPAPAGLVSDVSLTSSGNRVVIAWVQADGPGATSVYESRHATAENVLKSYLPLIRR